LQGWWLKVEAGKNVAGGLSAPLPEERTLVWGRSACPAVNRLFGLKMPYPMVCNER